MTAPLTPQQLIHQLPKAELHVHIEGTFEPELMFAIAKRNQIDIPYQTIEDVKNAYNFHNLQNMLNIASYCSWRKKYLRMVCYI